MEHFKIGKSLVNDATNSSTVPFAICKVPLNHHLFHEPNQRDFAKTDLEGGDRINDNLMYRLQQIPK